tara:strand:- start:3215 stop:4576 length:1362 start_codon:yes stop_codon:yes gene_type:complete
MVFGWPFQRWNGPIHSRRDASNATIRKRTMTPSEQQEANLIRSSDADRATSFLDDLNRTVIDLRTSLSVLFDVLGQDASKSQDVSRALGIDKSVSWKVCRLATSDSVVEAADLIPGQRGMRIFFDRAELAASPEGPLEEARAAFDRYCDMVEEHAVDRTGLAAILASMRLQDESASETASMRRAAYRENAILRGIKARARMGTFILGPGRGPNLVYDSVHMSGVVGLEWLRSNTTWTISRRSYAGPTAPQGDDRFHPLDPDAVVDGAPILSRYSSPDLQVSSTSAPGSGIREFRLHGDRVGRTSSVNGFAGWFLKEWADFRKEEPNQLGEYQLSIDLPVETTQVDLFVHHSLTTDPEVAATLLDTMQASLIATSVEDIPSLPLRIETIPLGMTNPNVETPLFGDYAGMIGDGFEALGCDASAFSGWRALIDFPPIPSRLALFQKLPVRKPDAR